MTTSPAAAIGTASSAPTKPPAAAADQDAEDDEERRDPDRVAHDDRDEDVALDELEDEVDAGDDEGELAARRSPRRGLPGSRRAAAR